MKRITLSLLIIVICITANSQKIYSTKSGQVRFNASSPVEKIAAVNNQTDSKMVDKSGQIVFSILVKSFKFENQLMEDHFNENYLESTKFPKAEFKGFITNVSSVNFTRDGKYDITVDGTLTLHGISQKIGTTGTLVMVSGKPTINGQFKIKIKDYGIKGLYIGDKIANEAEIAVNCQYD